MKDEGQRLAYLQALGITQYVPLQPFDGVPALPVLELETVVASGDGAQTAAGELSTREAAGTLSDTNPDTISAESQFIHDVVEQTVPTEEAIEVTGEQPVDVQAKASPEQNTDIPQLDLGRLTADLGGVTTAKPRAPQPLRRFTLAMVTLPQRLRLMVELASPDAPGFSALEHRMLGDLLLALDADTQISDANTRLFRWPFVNNPRIATDPGAARDGLFAFLAAAQSEQPVLKTLVLGSAPAGLFHSAEPGKPFPLAELENQPCMLTHSLAVMDQDWTLKAATWRHIRSFV